MTWKDATRMLPGKLVDLASDPSVKDLNSLRKVVQRELNNHYKGTKPRTPAEVSALHSFLAETRHM